MIRAKKPAHKTELGNACVAWHFLAKLKRKHRLIFN